MNATVSQISAERHEECCHDMLMALFHPPLLLARTQHPHGWCKLTSWQFDYNSKVRHELRILMYVDIVKWLLTFIINFFHFIFSFYFQNGWCICCFTVCLVFDASKSNPIKECSQLSVMLLLVFHVAEKYLLPFKINKVGCNTVETVWL